jgi:hypothetical protein
MRLPVFKTHFPQQVHTLARRLNRAHPHPTDRRRKLFGTSQDILAALAHLAAGKFEDTGAFSVIDAHTPQDLLLAVYRRVLSVEQAIADGKLPPDDHAHIMVMATWLMTLYDRTDWTAPAPRVTVRLKEVFEVRFTCL